MHVENQQSPIFIKFIVSMETGSKAQIWTKIDHFSMYLKSVNQIFFNFLHQVGRK